MPNVLVAEDDIALNKLICRVLEKSGHTVVSAKDGENALAVLDEKHIDLIVTDVMMPKMDGYEFIENVRSFNSSVPVLFVTAKGSFNDKLRGFNLGADDYMVKPIDNKELSARIKAVLRRCQTHVPQADDEIIRFENIEISLQKYELKLRNRSIDIPPKELELLYFLASNYNRVFTRDQLLDKVWGFDYLGDSRTVDVHIKRLREKLDGTSDKWVIKTVWGVGYKFELLN